MSNKPLVTAYSYKRDVFTVNLPLDLLSDQTLMTLILNPFIAPSGDTHHRETYVKCLNEGENQDPFTQEFVSPVQLVNNPLLREINYAVVNKFPKYEDGVVDDVNEYIKEKTGKEFEWFKKRVRFGNFFKHENGLYRLLKFCDAYDDSKKLPVDMKKFVSANRNMSPKINVIDWDEEEEIFTIEIPRQQLMCPEMKKMMVNPVTFESGNSFHDRSAPTLRETNETHAPNKFLKSLCLSAFMAKPELGFYNPFELMREAILDENIPLLNILLERYPEKFNQLASYQKDKLQTPLMFALEQKKQAPAKALYESDQVNVQVRDPRKHSALYYAMKTENESAIEALVFPLMVKPLLNNTKKYKGKGQKINVGTAKSLLPLQDVMLESFKNKVNDHLQKGEDVEALRLINKAGSTTNYFNQVMHTHAHAWHLRIRRNPIKLSCFSPTGDGLNDFLREKEAELRDVRSSVVVEQ